MMMMQPPPDPGLKYGGEYTFTPQQLAELQKHMTAWLVWKKQKRFTGYTKIGMPVTVWANDIAQVYAVYPDMHEVSLARVVLYQWSDKCVITHEGLTNPSPDGTLMEWADLLPQVDKKV